MEDKSSNKIIRCDGCNAELSEGIKFCTECGKLVEIVSENDENPSDKVICPKCNAEMAHGIKFCEECGTKIEHIQTHNQETVCPKCYAKVLPGTRFCEDCGTKIPNNSVSNKEATCPKCFADVPPGINFCEECGTKIGSTNNLTTCPKCYTDVIAGELFCTQCGASLAIKKAGSNAHISQELSKLREKELRNPPSTDETIDSIVESGKGLMKGFGGFLDKAASELSENLNQSNRSNYVSNRNINENLKSRRKNEFTSPGYLVCDTCEGYYRLQPGEAPDDFTDECECGGKLKHQKTIN